MSPHLALPLLSLGIKPACTCETNHTRIKNIPLFSAVVCVLIRITTRRFYIVTADVTVTVIVIPSFPLWICPFQLENAVPNYKYFIAFLWQGIYPLEGIFIDVAAIMFLYMT